MSEAASKDFRTILEEMVAMGASDLHVKVGQPPTLRIDGVLFQLDEPQADLAPINALFISRLAREHGVKVLLSGAGGDDVFTGYRRHFALGQEPLWAQMTNLCIMFPLVLLGGYLRNRQMYLKSDPES